jgi:hypothetical protein
MYDNGNQPYQSTQQGQYAQAPQYQQPQAPYPPAPYWQQPQPWQPPKRPYSGFAIASFVLGLVSWFSCGILIVPQILAFIFGILALQEIKRQRTRGRALALWGVVLGALMCTVYLIALVVTIANGDWSSTA